MSGYIYWISYLIIINLAAAAAVFLDKRRAKRHLWRIPERNLLLLSAFGGSPAMLLTMLLIRHKTRHAKFMAGIPAMMIAQGALVYIILRSL